MIRLMQLEKPFLRMKQKVLAAPIQHQTTIRQVNLQNPVEQVLERVVRALNIAKSFRDSNSLS